MVGFLRKPLENHGLSYLFNQALLQMKTNQQGFSVLHCFHHPLFKRRNISIYTDNAASSLNQSDHIFLIITGI